MTISASEAFTNLSPLIKQVNEDHAPVRISSEQGNAVLMAEDDFEVWQETMRLLSTPADAARLLAAVARDKAGQESTVTTTMDELRNMAEGPP
ncbi:type II toxin-antitoxin system Phd/YefM family antitoxin [Streptomyces lonarensis]|uniref:Antitoxin n=1 Tax=Streptomyces lonarensis TaxID=700599 RepID=A0A7X6D0G4_9ACTN|nr:type II toxin-antitoxin system Phd/YefM family antitoxin [Streptomyces lonarensis]NJQ05824.1 type II toxin-antitoxin system Phd/YefM family antitoxin [Streptomyces lonarensis]